MLDFGLRPACTMPRFDGAYRDAEGCAEQRGYCLALLVFKEEAKEGMRCVLVERPEWYANSMAQNR